jgi:23S rRNA (uracil1939-C5)-methyltransferase
MERDATIEVTIDALTPGGDGVGRRMDGSADDAAFFVPLTAPGDRVRALVETRGKRTAEARLVEVLAPSSDRVTPRCRHFGTCGGCAWQHVRIEAQTAAKRQHVRRALAKGIEAPPPVAEVAGSPDEYGYRHRATFAARVTAGGVVLGFARAHSHRIVDLAECPVLVPPLAAAIPALRAAVAGALGGRTGSAEVRAAFDPESGRVLAEIAWAKDGKHEAPPPRLVAIDGGRAAPIDEATAHYDAEGVRVAFAPGIFAQANLPANARLVAEVTGRIVAADPKSLLDVYCGVGNYTLPAARALGGGVDAHGIEEDARAVALAAMSAREAGLPRVSFSALDAETALARLAAQRRTFDVVICNPPRTGLTPGVIRAVVAMSPRAMVYVSCAPPTLARDLRALAESGYATTDVRPFDLFPQTPHVEVVASPSRA